MVFNDDSNWKIVDESRQQKARRSQAFLSFLLGCNVLRDANNAAHLPGSIPDWKSSVANPANRPVRLDNPIFLVKFSRHLSSDCGADARGVFVINCGNPGFRIFVDTLTGSTPDLFVSGTDIRPLQPIRGGEPKHCGDVSGELPELLFDIGMGQEISKGATCRFESVDFGVRPHPSGRTLIQTETTPPLTTGKDRQNDRNANVQSRHDGVFIFGQIRSSVL